MSATGVLLGFLNVCLYCAIIVLVAFVVKWVVENVFGWAIDGDVLKWGKIVVMLLCLIAVVAWLVGTLSGVHLGPRLF